ncbi:MAG: exodeoxyribonuclease VII small subunit [Candidatus Handelsmanbacteria bacterium]|nr:exodeoxyribonuclease VII small subunit [Candidatus Handelsmanbacteria bacterium]
MSEAPPTSFEEALSQLEDSAARLEEGDLSLEEALRVFERGVAASRLCARHLDQARQRVQVLQEDGEGNFRLESLDGDEMDGEEEEP